MSPFLHCRAFSVFRSVALVSAVGLMLGVNLGSEICIAATDAESTSVSLKAKGEEPTIVKGLQYVREAGNQWISDRGCVSCHQVPSMIWSHQAAAAAGIPIPKQELKKLEEWSTDVASFVKPHQRDDLDVPSTLASNIDTMTQMLLAIPKREGATWRKGFSQKLASEQADDGSWRACGQLPMQRRPKQETTATTTLWTTLALLRESEDFRQDTALQFADRVKDPVSAEYLAVRLLVAHQLGDDKQEDSLRQKLLQWQNDDGGWGWRREDSSDALGTGYALYALAVTGTDSPAISSAREFLKHQQQESGRWLVPGTKHSAKGETTETAIDWGSAWAVIALSSSIDNGPKTDL